MATDILQYQLLQAVVALLQQAPAVAELVQEARDVGAGFTQASLVNVDVPDSDPDGQALSGSPVMWTSTVVIDVFARAGTGVTGRKAASPVAAAVYARLMADTTLPAAGFQPYAPPRVQMDAVEAEDRQGGVRITWQIQHRSAWADLTTAA